MMPPRPPPLGENHQRTAPVDAYLQHRLHRPQIENWQHDSVAVLTALKPADELAAACVCERAIVEPVEPVEPDSSTTRLALPVAAGNDSGAGRLNPRAPQFQKGFVIRRG